MISNNRKALVLFPKSPELLRRTPEEPYAGLPWTDLDSLYSAMFDDVIETASSLDAVDLFILKNGQELSPDFQTRIAGKVEIIELPKNGIGEEEYYAFETLFSKKYDQIVLLLEPHPLLTKYDLRTIFELLQYDDDCIVVGQHADGNFYMLGLKSNHSEIFSIDGDPDLTKRQYRFMQRLCKEEIMVFPLLPKYSLDSGTNLLRLKLELEELAGGNGFSRRTRTMFKTLDKKYKIRRSR